MKKKERIIYQSNYFSDRKESEERKDFKSYLMECRDMDEAEAERMSKNDDDFYGWKNEQETFWFQSEEENLNVELNTRILAIADVGRWNGRVMGYKELTGNLSSILRSMNVDYLKVYVADREVKATGHHHDGTNYVTFRAWKDSTTDAQKERVTEAIYNLGYTVTMEYVMHLIKKYTRSLAKDVKKIYGW